MEEGQPSLPRFRVSVKFFVKIYFRLHERRAASPPWRDLAIDNPRSRLGGLHIHLRGLASQSFLHTTEFVLPVSNFLDSFLSCKFCLFLCML